MASPLALGKRSIISSYLLQLLVSYKLFVNSGSSISIPWSWPTPGASRSSPVPPVCNSIVVFSTAQHNLLFSLLLSVLDHGKFKGGKKVSLIYLSLEYQTWLASRHPLPYYKLRREGRQGRCSRANPKHSHPAPRRGSPLSRR